MKATQWIEVSALAVLALCAVAYLATPLLPKTDTPPMKVVELTISAAAAIATAAAAVVALHFGLTAQRAQEARAQAVAGLAASRVMMQIARLRAALDIHFLMCDADPRIDSIRLCIKNFAHAVESDPTDISRSDLVDLLAHGPDWPARLSVALAGVESVRSFPGLIDEHWEAAQMDVRKAVVLTAQASLRFSLSELNKIWDHLHTTARAATGRPGTRTMEAAS